MTYNFSHHVACNSACYYNDYDNPCSVTKGRCARKIVRDNPLTLPLSISLLTELSAYIVDCGFDPDLAVVHAGFAEGIGEVFVIPSGDGDIIVMATRGV